MSTPPPSIPEILHQFHAGQATPFKKGDRCFVLTDPTVGLVSVTYDKTANWIIFFWVDVGNHRNNRKATFRPGDGCFSRLEEPKSEHTVYKLLIKSTGETRYFWLQDKADDSDGLLAEIVNKCINKYKEKDEEEEVAESEVSAEVREQQDMEKLILMAEKLVFNIMSDTLKDVSEKVDDPKEIEVSDGETSEGVPEKDDSGDSSDGEPKTKKKCPGDVSL